MNHRTARVRVATVQGLYYMLTGIWPLVDLRSFEAITGSKRDRWLVRVVGALVSAVGMFMLYAVVRRNVQPEISVLGAGSAIGLGAIEAVYSARGVISKVYLLDALIECGLVVGWVLSTRGRRGELERGGNEAG